MRPAWLLAKQMARINVCNEQLPCHSPANMSGVSSQVLEGVGPALFPIQVQQLAGVHLQAGHALQLCPCCARGAY